MFIDFNLAYWPPVGVKDCVMKTPGIAIISRQERLYRLFHGPRELAGRWRVHFKVEEIEALFKHDFADAVANGLATAGAYRGREARASSLSLASSAMSVAISAFSCLIPSADIRTSFLPYRGEPAS